MTGNELNLLPPIVRERPQTWVKPNEFFVAWGGVPTLAYRGFSRVLLDVKARVSAVLPGLKPENPGARWPKTTLGALREGRTLTHADALALRRVCTALECQVAREEPIPVQSLSLVVFACRSLERRLLTFPIPLLTDRSGPDAAQHQAPEEHQAEVHSVMAQFAEERVSEYLPKLQSPDNRETHYRAHHIEATLVFDLGPQQPACIQDFVQAVDEALPGYYSWFEPVSRHMTVRGLG
jgi:hypothetical protein